MFNIDKYNFKINNITRTINDLAILIDIHIWDQTTE